MLGFWNHQDRLLERCQWAFAEPVIVYPVGKDPAGYLVRGIWETPAANAPLGTVQGLSNQATTIAFRVLELPDAEVPSQGLQIEARAARWEVVDVEQDGGGHVFCRIFRIGPGGTTAPLPPIDDGAPIPEPVPVTELLTRWRSAAMSPP
jgi:hypothetical protein